MDSKVNEIIICLGSSCFARGNKKTLRVIQEYIQDHKLEDAVSFRGNHCFGNCQKGPVLKLNNLEYEGISDADILSILDKELNHLKKV